MLMGSGLQGIIMTDRLVQSASQNIVNDAFIDSLYDAVAYAEMPERYTKEALGQSHPFIRTSVTPRWGSTAYGPLQITGGPKSMMNFIYTTQPGSDSVHDLYKYRGGLTQDEIDYMGRFVNQANKFLKYGREPNKEGYDKRYDYSDMGQGSGIGDLSSLEDRKTYESLAKKILHYEFFDQAGADPMLFLKNWKMGKTKSMEEFDRWRQSEDAQQYIQRFNSNLAY